jgi:hypothetical protein
MLTPAASSASLRLGGRVVAPRRSGILALSSAGALPRLPSPPPMSSRPAYRQTHYQSHHVQRCSKASHASASRSASGRKAQQQQQPQPHTATAQRTFTSINQETPYNLCFLRHGQSTWNRDNRFIGWTDTPLTDDGVLEARLAGRMLANSGILFDEVHTSLLRRSIRTVNLVLMEMGQEYIPVHKHWRLNERNYGELVGKNKKETVKLHGKEQVKRWRRSYDEPPPPMCPEHEYHPAKDPRYRHVSSVLYVCAGGSECGLIVLVWMGGVTHGMVADGFALMFFALL